MDHIKKLVYIIVGCLTIVSLVFTLCNKVGHCASSGSSVLYNSFPLPVGSDFGTSLDLSDSDFDIILNHSYSFDSDFPRIDMLCLYEVHEGNNLLVLRGFYNPIISVSPNMNDFFSDSSSSISISNGTSWKGHIQITYNYVTHDVSYTWYNNGVSVGMTSWCELQPNNTYSLKTNTNLYGYPLWIRSNSNYFSNDVSGTPIISGHTKGGVLSNFIDSEDLLEDSSAVPKVDVVPPTNQNNYHGWLSKILNGLGVLNNSIQGGVLTIGDYLGQIKEVIENAFSWFIEPPDSDTIMDNVEPYLAQNDLISGFLSSRTAIQGVYSSIGNVTAKNRSQMIWDIPFNLPSMSQTFHARIDFGWYENIRSTFEPFLNMFLCVGFLFSFIRSIPGILHGNSGEGDT